MVPLGGLTRVPLAFLCLYNESTQCTIPVLIPGVLSLQKATLPLAKPQNFVPPRYRRISQLH